MSKIRGRRPVWGATLAVVCLTLTGCAGLRPGVAAQVGDETITVDEVDAVAADFCAAVEPQLEQQAESIPHSYFRSGIAGTLALRSVAEQLAAERGVDVESDAYLQQLADLRRGVAAVPEDYRDSVVLVESAPAYVEAVQAAVGEQVLDGDGEEQDFIAAGADEMAAWIAAHEVEFDPALNTRIEDGTIATRDESVSFALSETARAGLEEQPNSVTARQLPATQRCGR